MNVSRQAQRWTARKLQQLASRLYGIEAAGNGHRWKGGNGIGNLSEATAAGSKTIQVRSTEQAINNPWMANAIATLVSNYVGTGIVIRSKCETEAVRKKIQKWYERWLEECDHDGRHDFYGLQALAVREMVVKGEAFIQLLQQGTTLKLKAIPADMVDASLFQELSDKRHIYAGIEFDADGKRLAYHILPRRRGTALLQDLGHIRVPAEDMLHLFVPLEPGQVRGLSWLTPALLRSQTLDSYEDAQLKRQQVSALFAGFVRDVNGTSGPFDGEKSDGILETGMEPGALHVLDPGQDIQFPNLPDTKDFPAFVQWQLRAIAAGLGITYEQLTGDYSQVTYSSSRAALLEFRRTVESIQHLVIVKQFLQPVYERLIALAAIDGVIDLAAYSAEPEAFHTAEYLPPAWPWVDPEKDAKAAILEIENGLTSRTRVAAQKGYSVEEIDEERKRDEGQERGLTNQSSVGTTPAPGTMEDAA